MSAADLIRAAAIAAEAARADAHVAALATLATATISAGAAAWSTLQSIRSQKQLERLRADLAVDAADLNAKRDYEYEAKKRLYAECEPAHFRLLESSQAARARIATIARVARSHPDQCSGWMRNRGHRLYTLYRLTSPLVHFSVLREKVTNIDLRLSPEMHFQYVLGRLLYDSFADDDALASGQVNSPLEYRPGELANGPDAPNPVYHRQGIPFEQLEPLIDNMRIDGDVIGPAGFLKAADDDSMVLNSNILELDYLFRDFTPNERPVLWRLLIYQTAIYNGAIDMSSRILGSSCDPIIHLKPSDLDLFIDGQEHADALIPFLKARNERLTREMYLSRAIK